MTSAAKENSTTSVGSSGDWQIKEGGNDRREAEVWQADVTRKKASFMSMRHHLELMAGRMVKLNMKDSK